EFIDLGPSKPQPNEGRMHLVSGPFRSAGYHKPPPTRNLATRQQHIAHVACVRQRPHGQCKFDMTIAAPAIIDIRTADKTSALAKWLRGIGVRQVRLACGLVMFSYIFSHFFNHALGNFSYDTM